MDDIDLTLLEALERDSRTSLKALAPGLGLKPGAVYSRLYQLREEGVIQHYTVRINPNAVGITSFAIFEVILNKALPGTSDDLFVGSFLQYLHETFPEVQVSGLSPQETIYGVACFRDAAHAASFWENLRANPFVKHVETRPVRTLLHGHKLFAVGPGLVSQVAETAFFDDSRGV
jgi:DNA-binding Lrp family transcriptional regulator